MSSYESYFSKAIIWEEESFELILRLDELNPKSNIISYFWRVVPFEWNQVLSLSHFQIGFMSYWKLKLIMKDIKVQKNPKPMFWLS